MSTARDKSERGLPVGEDRGDPILCDLEGRPTTLYNGACPVCGPEIRRYQRIDSGRRGDLGWQDVSQSPENLAALGLDLEDVKERLHVVDQSGRIHIGVDAFIVLWAALPGHRWLSVLVRAPLIRPVATWAYDRILAPALYRWNRRRDRRRKAVGSTSEGRG